jgi:hypothetical protein
MVEQRGCTVIIISYNRPQALESLLRGLSMQHLAGSLGCPHAADRNRFLVGAIGSTRYGLVR